MINTLLHVWTMFYLLVYFNCLKWTSYRSVLMFIWSLIFIKSLIFLYYINNLINTLNTYLNALSESIEPVNLLLIFRKKREDKICSISWVTGEIKSSVIKFAVKSKVSPWVLGELWHFLFYRHRWNYILTSRHSLLQKCQHGPEGFPLPILITISCPPI